MASDSGDTHEDNKHQSEHDEQHADAVQDSAADNDHKENKDGQHTSPASNQDDKDNQTLASMARASKSSLNLGGVADDQADNDERDNVGVDEAGDDKDAFMLVARLRSQITDLTSQVTSLNSKLVRSYTQTGDLEDELHDVRDHEQRLQHKVKELEDYKQRWEKEIERGGWVERAHVQGEMRQLMSKVLEETKSKETAVEGQKALETEIENLTSSLFDEANKMVAVERMSRARAEEKMQSLEDAGATMKDLFDSVQANLRDTVTRMEGKDKEIERLKRKMLAAGVAPETPDIEKDPSAKEEVTVSDGSQMLSLDRSAASTAPHSPNFGILSPPRLLTGVLPFQEFLAFVAYLRQLRTTVLARPLDSVNYAAPYGGGGPTMSMRGFPTLQTSRQPSQTGVPTMPTPTQMLTPHLPLSTHLSQPFLKRCIDEDSDPSLRLDIAPGLGFLSRRNIGTAIVDGTLVIEPFFAGTPGAELPSGTCCLCGTSLERWSKGAPIAKPATAAVANVNSTMKKMLGSSGWFNSGNSSKNGTTTPPTIEKSEQPTSPTKTTFTAVPFDFPSKDPVDPNHQIHIFRVNETATSKYAVCPSYCLVRLRAVCEFWTYVRAIERGLLLEEGFRFGKGWTEAGATPRDKDNVAGLGFTDAIVEPKVTVTVASDTEKAAGGTSDVTEQTQQNNEKESDDEKQPDMSSQSTEDEHTLNQDVSPEDKADNDASMSPDSSKTPALTSHGNASTGSLNKPPVPKRSAARGNTSQPQTPVMREEKQASYPSSPALGSIDPVDPNVRPVKGGLHVDTAGNSNDDNVIVGSSSLGWEDHCWTEVVRLKECMFWTRVAAVEQDTSEPVASRLAVARHRR
ncbi:hypothetical protein OIO90_004824 [Microbotryomycetes sp. JL221]|nr:hypothetical protein OIO90_004824 [Microbotryomycetes sp. JL221]